MVFYKERDHEQPSLSLILPHLYLGAETDVTQDCLSSRGISYVLSVSRCSPQPSFLPCSQYLRIPIDDSLRDDLLPWIPEALEFIDGALNSGDSVLVHCAAGISRSPALAVAYIMYHLGMDLDHAYRFVKERRPTISPNFNFLGQLQHFQGTLTQKTFHGNNIVLPVKCLDTCPQPTSKNVTYNSPLALSASQSVSFQNNHVTKGCRESERGNSEPCYNPEEVEQGSHSTSTEQQNQQHPSHLTLSLSSHLRTLALTHNLNQKEGQTTCKATTPVSFAPAHPTPTSTQLSFTSLSEKRKSLTLSLSPATTTYPTFNQKLPKSGTYCSEQARTTNTSSMAHQRETYTPNGGKTHSKMSAVVVASSFPSDLQTRKGNNPSKAMGSIDVQGNKDVGCACVGKAEPCKAEKPRGDPIKGEAEERRGAVKSQPQQVAPETKLTTSGVEAEESCREQDILPSPLNLTVNKLLGWGERILLGLFLAPRIKMGQTALPHRCR
ncbi:uncharacterized protein FYW47_011394 [Aplochiton taeniatus]